jgi:hypothetical protein
LSALDAVPGETPARRATSVIVTGLRLMGLEAASPRRRTPKWATVPALVGGHVARSIGVIHPKSYVLQFSGHSMELGYYGLIQAKNAWMS